MALELTVTAAELPSLINIIPPRVKWLSLDCFGTLLWRNCVSPRDVFCDLPAAHGDLWHRVAAEQKARQKAYFAKGKAEVTLDQIYAMLSPTAPQAEVDAAVAAEIDAEARLCFGFQPTVDLMKAAKAKGLKIMFVSDTYLTEDQLRDLIARAAGEDVAAMIDRIFVSSAFGISKSEGLFKPVLSKLNVGAEALFHVGDNKNADQIAPAKLGIATAHLKQFSDEQVQRLRLEVSAASMVDQKVRTERPAFAPHRPVLSLHGSEDPVHALGHDALGPIMHGYAQWVRAEQEELEARLGKKVKLLFLMRDGHLPLKVYRAIYGESEGAAVSISRFTGRRSSFLSRADVEHFLSVEPIHGRTEVLTRTLGLTAEEGRKLCGGVIGFEAQKKFSKGAILPDTAKKVVARSRDFGDRLCAHLAQAGVEHGDAVMFVDLGYVGTVQNLVEPMLRERMGLSVHGRYLLFRDTERGGLDKKGMIDTRHFDYPAVHALTMSISVVEQLCTIAEGSVVDYEADGTVIREAAGSKGAESATRDAIQDACVEFAAHAHEGVVRPAVSDDADSRRHQAMASLARLLFLPTAPEVEVLKAFDLDVNMGTTDKVGLIDTDQAQIGLRRRGLFYVNQTNRMYLSGELRAQGLAEMMTVFASARHQFDLRPADFEAAPLELQAFLVDDSSQTITTIDARPTHDGYYQALVPVGEARFAVGLQFGAVAEWLQIEECAFHGVHALHDTIQSILNPSAPGDFVCDDMKEEAPGFYRVGEGGLMLVPPPTAHKIKGAMMLSIVFRPVVRRAPTDAIALQEAA